MAIDIGRVAYESYKDKTDGKKFIGIELFYLLPWEYLSKIEQDAWRAVGVAVIQYMDDQKLDDVYNEKEKES